MGRPRLDEPWLGQLTGAELIRKTLHLGVGLLAFALADLGLGGSTLLLVSLAIFNLWLWPHLGGRALWRADQRGFDVGIALYPTVLLVLLLLFRRLDVVAAVWGILALGDGAATLAGRVWGATRPLPWNAAKSWPGLWAHLLCGGAGAFVLLLWTWCRLSGETPGQGDLLLAASAALVAALASALVESLPQGLDDNLTAPPLSALVLWGWLETKDFWTALLAPIAPGGPSLHDFALAAGIGLGVSLVLLGMAWRAGSIDRSGVVAGVLLGTMIATFLGAPGYSLLVAFFVLGSGATRVGWAAKVARGVAQGNRGRRGAKNALANASVPTLLAFFAVATPHGELLRLAFVAAFATAAADTVSSELGQLWGHRPIMITTLRAARPGVDGAISLSGTLAGVVASLIVAGLAGWVGLCSATGILLATLAALGGNLLDSLLGATLEKQELLDNEGVNFLATLGGALLAMALAV